MSLQVSLQKTLQKRIPTMPAKSWKSLEKALMMRKTMTAKQF